MNEDDKGSTFIDGGFGANNPSEEVYYSVQQLRNNQQHAVGELVSIGTGKKESGKKEFLKLHRYINLAIKWATESEKTHESMLRISQRDDFSYSRFNVEQGLGKIKLDTWKGKQGARTLTLMRKKTQEYLQTGHVMEDVDAVAMRLVQIRHSRARQPVSDRWEQFCHGVEYSCFFSTCSARERVRVEDLRQHLQNAHSMTEEEIESSLEQCKRYALFESIWWPLSFYILTSTWQGNRCRGILLKKNRFGPLSIKSFYGELLDLAGHRYNLSTSSQHLISWWKKLRIPIYPVYAAFTYGSK